MLAAYLTALAIVAVSLLLGRSVLVACGQAPLSWLSGGVGLAALLVLAGIGIRLPGRTVVVVVLVALACVLAAIFLISRPGRSGPGAVTALVRKAAPPALLAALLAGLPFFASGRVGALGAGLVNDDMASHLAMADWVGERSLLDEPVLIGDGYPLGPHGIAATAGQAAGLVEAFAGLTIAIAALAALTALHLLGELPGLRRTAGAALAALPYLGAAYLSQGAFKEPLLALLLIVFALGLDSLRADRALRGGVVLGLIVAGAVYNYSFPALFWFAGTVAIWAALALVRGGRLDPGAVGERIRGAARPLAGALAVGAAVALALNLPELGRIARFAGFQAFDPGTDGLGNLAQPLSPLEALGIWPTADFRLTADAAGLPAPLFYLGGALGAIALGVGIASAWRGRRLALLGALCAAAAMYAGSAATVSAYTSAKALAIAASLVALTVLRGLLAPAEGAVARAGGDGRLQVWRAWPLARGALALVFVLAAAGSSFLVLRQAAVGAEPHPRELERMRSLVAGEDVLFLGRDNFVLYNLRGARPHTHVRNYYNPYFVRPRFDLRSVFAKFDIDALRPPALRRFPYVITTRAAYASGLPPRYEPLLETESYILWRRAGGRTPAVDKRRPAEPGPEPGAWLRCAGARPPAGIAAWLSQPPVRLDSASWAPAASVEDGGPAAAVLDLPPGDWELSLTYVSTQALVLRASGLAATLPANLDYRGTAPLWPAGRVEGHPGGPLRVLAAVAEPPLVARLLGARSSAHLGALAATPAGAGYGAARAAAEPPFPGAGARLGPAPRACGRYADWVTGG